MVPDGSTRMLGSDGPFLSSMRMPDSNFSGGADEACGPVLEDGEVPLLEEQPARSAATRSTARRTGRLPMAGDERAARIAVAAAARPVRPFAAAPATQATGPASTASARFITRPRVERPVPHPPAAIVARDLRKSFGKVEALRGLSLTVETGRIVVILGPNGAGKTTLVRILATLLRPDGGQATVAGRDVVR